MKNKMLTGHTFKHTGIFLLLTVVIVSGCNNDFGFVSSDNAPVYFNATYEESLRASGTKWDNGDRIGVFAIESQKALLQENIIDGNENLPFITNGSGLFVQSGKSMVYPSDGSSMDIVSYYPYTSGLSGYNYSIDIAAQTDFFYSNNLKGINKNSVGPNVLNFKRALSKLVINISPKTDGESLEGLTATLTGAKTRATFSLATADFTYDNNSVAALLLPVSGNSTLQQVSALLLPTESGGKTEIRFAIGTTIYTWTVPDALESGKLYSYNIKLDKAGTIITPSGYMEVPVYTAGGDAPNSYKALHMVGNTSWLNQSHVTGTVSLRNYSVLFNAQYRIPYWVAYPMHPVYLDGGNRVDDWIYDPIIPQSYQPYLNSRSWSSSADVNRGHMLASADRNASRAINATTFYCTNVVPQDTRMNGGTWERLEEKVRDWCAQTAYDTLYVVTGCILPVAPELVTYANDNLGVGSAIPKYMYKALLRKNKSTGNYSSIAFKMENAYTGITYANSIVSVAELEAETGFTFFSGLPAAVAATVKQNKSLSPNWN